MVDTMDVVYKTFEPDKGFEQIQADIYNQAVKKYNGQTVTADQIAQRMKSFDPPQDTNGLFFAFTKDDKPLSYIQYRFYEKTKIFIGHAWSVDDCPVDVQQAMYDKIFDYVKQKYPDNKEIYLGYVYDHFTDVVAMIKKQGFEHYNSITFYSVKLEELAKLEADAKYTSREATLDDLAVLLDLALDSNLKSMGETQLNSYFKDKVLKDGNCIILFEGDKPVASTAIINGHFDGKESLARFVALREGYKDSYKSLLIHLAKYALGKGLTLPIQTSINDLQKEYSEFIPEIGTVKQKESAYVKKI